MRQCNCSLSFSFLFSFSFLPFSFSFSPTHPVCLSQFVCLVSCDSALLFRRRVSQMAYSKRPSQNWALSIACNSFGRMSDALRAPIQAYRRRRGPRPVITQESQYHWARSDRVSPVRRRTVTVTHININIKRWVPACQRCIKNVQQIRKKVRQQYVVAKH